MTKTGAVKQLLLRYKIRKTSAWEGSPDPEDLAWIGVLVGRPVGLDDIYLSIWDDYLLKPEVIEEVVDGL